MVPDPPDGWLRSIEAENDLTDAASGRQSDSADADATPVVKLVNGIIADAIAMGASDIHLEPFRDGVRVRYRIDGCLADKMTCPLSLGPALTSRVKILARCDMSERRLPQDGTLDVAVGGKTVHLTVSVLPTGTGERMVLKVLDKGSFSLDLKAQGVQAADLERIHRAIRQPTGMVLVAGPRGSRPKSILYALLSWLNTSETCILSAENPIELNFHGIGQIQVKEELGFTYAVALSAFRAQDPDVVMIQELEDSEAARAAVEMATENCLVLSSVTAGNATDALAKVIELGVPPSLLSTVTRLIISQRTIRRLCRDCKVPYVPPRDQLETAGILTGQLPPDLTLYRPGGCDNCGARGYRGRLLVYEILDVGGSIQDAVAGGASGERIRQLAIEAGMETIFENAWRRALEGQTSLEECLRVV